MGLFGRKKEETTEETKEVTASAPKKVAKKAAKTTAKKDGAASTLNFDAVLLEPRITEKAAILSDNQVYVFNVPQDATKDEVVEAVKEVYNVTPRKVAMVRMRPQAYLSRARGRRGQRKGYKKAYVYTKKGETIEIL